MRPKRILVVDDDHQIALVLETLLLREGFDVSIAGDARQMWECLRREAISLITLDLNLGDDDGFTLAREIRGRFDLPIIVISGKADDVDRIVGLELGADDYITKPFNPREVLARIRAVLRRCGPRATTAAQVPAADLLCFGGLVMNLGARAVETAAGAPVELTTAEFNLLSAFVERPKRVLSRDTLLDLLKGIEWSPIDRSIDTLIARLRKKIEADPERPVLVKTVRGVGYVFTADVTRC